MNMVLDGSVDETAVRSLGTVYRPAKVNYGVFGNLCPNIHRHLGLQTCADDPSKPLNMLERDVRLPAEEYATTLVTLRREVHRE